MTVIVAIGGLDPGGGAGLGRDLLTATALGAAVRMVGTAWAEQSSAGVHRVDARPAEALEDALRWALREPRPDAVKIGMVPGPDAALAIERGLAAFAGPVVIDPVLAASSGGALWRAAEADRDGGADGLEVWRGLLARATLATPNAVEAAALARRAVVTPDDAAAAGQALRAAGAAAVLVKGGHLVDGGDRLVTDVLVTTSGARRYARPRAPGPSPRGTGCALATALAVALAEGLAVEAAVERATAWLAERIRAAVERDGERRLA